MDGRIVITLVVILYYLRLIRDSTGYVLISYVRLWWVPYLEFPQVFSKTVAVDSSDSAYFFKKHAVLLEFLLFSFSFDICNSWWLLSPIVWKVKCLVLFCGYVIDVGPFTFYNGAIIIYQDWRHSESICCFRHQVSNYAFVRLPLVDLPELLLTVELGAYAIL